MIIKQKSLIVALVSSFVLSLVLVLTLIGYVAYIELKGEELKIVYADLLQRANAKVYERHIILSNLAAKIDLSGALNGKPFLEGTVSNNGPRNISGLTAKVKFMDGRGAVIYEERFNPCEPALGSAGLVRVKIGCLQPPKRAVLKSGETLPFKAVLSGLLKEVRAEVARDTRRYGRWSGKLAAEVQGINF